MTIQPAMSAARAYAALDDVEDRQSAAAAAKKAALEKFQTVLQDPAREERRVKRNDRSRRSPITHGRA
jgi:hypothetical protein